MTNKVNYNNINKFIDNLNDNEKKYLYKKIKQIELKKYALNVSFTINDKIKVNS